MEVTFNEIFQQFEYFSSKSYWKKSQIEVLVYSRSFELKEVTKLLLSDHYQNFDR